MLLEQLIVYWLQSSQDTTQYGISVHFNLF